MKKVIKIFFVYILISTNLSVLNAQPVKNLYFIPDVFKRSPSAAALEKYSNYPVSTYTGLPDISIPLYVIQSGDLNIPISLSYHASGIKVSETATWVGLGWSLNAGGNISRQIEGDIDERGFLGKYKGYKSLNPYTDDGMDSLYHLVLNHAPDTRPDIYHYNLPGHVGKFFFNPQDSYKPVLIPYAPLAISHNIINLTVDTLRFDILDENGNSYRLGYNYKEITNTGTSSSVARGGVTNWLLERVISQSKLDTVKFSYNSISVAQPDQPGEAITTEGNDSYYSNSSILSGYANYVPQTRHTATSAYGNEQFLNHIYFKNGRVDFIFSSSARQDNINGYPLDSINVYSFDNTSKSYVKLKSIKLFTSYFNQNQNGLQRLKLDSVSMSDKIGSKVQVYAFNYNNTPLPGYQSYSRDQWGYYNGRMNDPNIPYSQQSLIPQMNVVVLGPGSGGANYNYTIGSNSPYSRDPDSTYMQAGILTSVHYPTGGHTDFIYQANRYFDQFNTLHLAGGLRVQTVSSYDNINPTPTVKTYIYNNSVANFITTPTGQLNYGFFHYKQQFRYWEVLPGTDGGHPTNPSISRVKDVDTYYSESALNLTPSEGNPVAYTTVTEYTGSPTNNTGKIIYSYNFVPDAFAGSVAQTGIPVVYDYSFVRGTLKSKTAYRLDGSNNWQPVQQEENTYGAFPGMQMIYNDVGVAVGEVQENEGQILEAYSSDAGNGDAYRYRVSSYGIVSGDNYLTSTTTTNYDNLDPSKSTPTSTQYAYGNIAHQQPTAITHTDARGGVLTIHNKYPADYLLTPNYTTTYNNALDAMLAANIQATVIEKYANYNNPTTSVNGVVSAELHNYTVSKGDGYTPLPDYVNKLKVAASLPDFTTSNVNSSTGQIQADARYQQAISFDVYDQKNNLLVYTPRGGTATRLFWDYNYNYPVAKIEGLPAFALISNTAYTGFEADSKGLWSYSGSPVNGTAFTGKKSYLLSSGAITSPGILSSQVYIVSYWSNSGAATVSNGSAVAGMAVKTVNGWTLYEHQLPLSTSQITLSGSATIDDLRLYPKGFQLTSYTYDPLVGMTTTTDAKGQVTYYEYDNYQRLLNIKDKDGNVVKHNEYHYVNQ